MCGIQFVESLDGQDNAIAHSSTLLTLDGEPISHFIDELPVVHLTPGKASNVNTANFEELANVMETLKNLSIQDANRIRSLEEEIANASRSNWFLKLKVNFSKKNKILNKF